MFCFWCHSESLCRFVGECFVFGVIGCPASMPRLSRPHADQVKQRIAHIKSMGEKLTHSQQIVKLDSPCDDNTQPYHTGSVAAQVNKDRAFRRTPGRRCQVCYWCIIEDSRKRQHHHRHLEHKDNKSCRETSGTNTRNGQVQMEYPWTL